MLRSICAVELYRGLTWGGIVGSLRVHEEVSMLADLAAGMMGERKAIACRDITTIQKNTDVVEGNAPLIDG